MLDGAQPGRRVLAFADLARRHDALLDQNFILRSDISHLSARVAGLQATLANERIRHIDDSRKQIASHSAAIDSASTMASDMLKLSEFEAERRLREELSKCAVQDAAVIATLTTSLWDAEAAAIAQAASAAAEARARENDIRLYGQKIAALVDENRSLKEQLTGAKEAASHDHAGHRQALRSLAEEHLELQRSHRFAARNDVDANIRILTNAVATLEDELARAQDSLKRQADEREQTISERLAELSQQLARAAEEPLEVLRGQLDELRASHASDLARLEQSHEATLAACEEMHAARLAEQSAQHSHALADQDAALRAEMQWAQALHDEQRAAQCELVDELKARLRDREAARTREVADLHTHLAAQSEALGTAREALEWQRAESERTSAERRRDSFLRARIERQWRIYHTETGLEPWPMLKAQPGAA